MAHNAIAAPLRAFTATHFQWSVSGAVATITLDRPERKNPLTFDSYAELGRTFRDLTHADDVDVVVLASNGGNFCSGGDVHDIIGPLVATGIVSLTRKMRWVVSLASTSSLMVPPG